MIVESEVKGELRDEQIKDDPEFAEELIESEDIEDDLLDDVLEEDTEPESEATASPIDRLKLIFLGTGWEVIHGPS